MSIRLTPLLAAAALAATAAPAHAAVYGGATSDGEPIGLVANKGGKLLSAVMIAWDATCDDQTRFGDWGRYTPAHPTNGFEAGPGDLLMTRNAKGRFAGALAGIEHSGDVTASVSVTITGKLTAKSASGTLSAVVKLTTDATGASAGSCQTGSVHWGATRAPGTIFAGTSSQGAPVVVRVDRGREFVRNVYIGWSTHSCTNGLYYSYPDGFGRLPITSIGTFAATMPFTAHYDDGTKRDFVYDLSGRVKKTTARGTLRVTTADSDATGAPTFTCDSGTITWKALTG